MRHFTQLTKEEREDALAGTTASIVDSILTGVLDIQFVNPKNQIDFDIITREAAAHDSIRYAQYSIQKHAGISGEIAKIALIICTESCYDDNGFVIKDESPKEKMS